MEIVADNIRAAQAVHRGAMLEGMGVFAVADKVVEHFLTGLLPVSRTATGERLVDYWKQRSTRLSDAERRSLYSRVLGMGPRAATDVTANREFPDLWDRFLGAVAEYARRSDAGSRGTAAAVARALGLNLSAHAPGGVAAAAVELTRHARLALDLLAEPEVSAAYGASDLWQVVDRVSNLYLGGARNVGRQWTLAEAAQRILTWLADAGGSGEPDVGVKSLVDAVEQWLALSDEADRGKPPRARDIGPEVREQVKVLLTRSPAFSRLSPVAQASLARHATAVGMAIITRLLGRPRATDSLITAVDFPRFVAGLIEGVFHAIVDASMRQMEAYAELLASVAASLDAFARQPRGERGPDWLISVDEALLAAITRIIVTDGLVKPRIDLRAKRRQRR